jgi:tetratricopeptide (TPR) repeat protein
MKGSRGNPQIYHYLKQYQADPRSRVFAPLAEAYRKAGLLDEAIEICRDGIRHHPNFIGGKVALARALFDKGDFENTAKELGPVVLDAPDNLIAQKLLAESYLILGRLTESLAAYKVLLFFMPNDEEIAKLVHELEAKAYEEGALVLVNDPTPLRDFSVQSAESAISKDPGVIKREWINRIELLQSLLVRVQRIKLANHG